MLTFIHTSDWHIGHSFADFDRETAKKLNRARLLAVESIFIYAGMKKIPLIVSIGDTIDNGRLAPEKNLLDLFKVVKRYPEISLVIIPGEQDALGANSIYGRMVKDAYPENVTLLTQSKVLRGLGALFQKLPWPPGAFDRIGFGFTLETGYDYLALGGNHSYAKIDDRTYYCGSPEPLGFGQQGFPLEVRIEKPGAVPKVEKITGVQQYTWLQQEIEISNENVTGLKELLEIGDKEIKKLAITGFLSPGNYKTYKELLENVHNRYYEIVSRVAISPGAIDLPGGDACMKSVIQRLIDMKKESLPEEILNDVIPIGQPATANTARSISKDEIIDNALMKIYKYLGDLFEKRSPWTPPKTFS